MLSSVYWWSVTCSEGDAWTTKYTQEAPHVVREWPQGSFVVLRGNLAGSVLAFTVCGVVCIATLAVRRKFVGAELGGPSRSKWLSSALFVLLWVTYISVSIANTTKATKTGVAAYML